MFKQVEVLVRFPCFILFGFKIDDLLCQKFWDSEIEMNENNPLALTKSFMFVLVLIGFNFEKEGQRRN